MQKIVLLLVTLYLVDVVHGMQLCSDVLPDTVQVNRDNVILRFQLGDTRSDVTVRIVASKSCRKDKVRIGFLVDDCLYPICYSKLQELDLIHAVLSCECNNSIVKLTVPKKQN